MLRPVARASALCGAGSALCFAALALARGLPIQVAWGLAYGTVVLAMLCLGGFGWIVLTLPPGAPWRRNGFRVAAALGVVLCVAWIVARAA